MSNWKQKFELRIDAKYCHKLPGYLSDNQIKILDRMMENFKLTYQIKDRRLFTKRRLTNYEAGIIKGYTDALSEFDIGEG